MEIILSSETLGSIRHVTECHLTEELCHKNYAIPRFENTSQGTSESTSGTQKCPQSISFNQYVAS